MPRLSLTPRWILRAVLALVVVGSLVAGAALTAAYEPPEIQSGTVEKQANGTTYVAVQGFHFQGEDAGKKPARLVAAGPNAQPEWIYNGSKYGASWFYSVDPLENGNLLVVNTAPGETMVYELDPDTRERVWQQNFSIEDTHDVDLINDDQLLVANMRNTENGTSNDRIFVYDLGEDEIVWEWHFKDHYPNDTDNGISSDDWSHVNDVDKIGDGEYLISPRNFDQVAVVNRSTGNITMRLGEDDDYDVMNEQHNPQYLESENGTPTILVADSENDRVVEYACTDRSGGECDWERVWTVGEDQLNWPRDADRLPNGNTLIVDSMNHRVIEVTPEGEIVWEAYTPWAPFDAERGEYGNEPGGPTMQEQNVSGSYELSGSAGETPGTGDERTFPEWLTATFGETPVGGPATDLADTWKSLSQWVKPVWMAPWTLVFVSVALVVGLPWAVAELVSHRRRVVGGVRRGVRQFR
ncbi:Arylsulfotransferase (ASST) [Halopelagius inordinatus]|uniref:Arylsulfotransferase (ASST) n=1 Tax=Halopelagius inordinatus TaxID=553467 RepID=A0A1I2P5Z4_9EURY|nr:aryl-sulfate sulfotransferase [Halopelagius inordinatus]SFG08901.1 Arylsulfotransferase (ASST) [Halopelagius inordinatus]